MQKDERILHLDGLRGLAILSVILFHAYSRWNHIEPWEVNDFTKKVFSNGWLGVDLFFIISGFVIYWTLDKCPGLCQFTVKRWLRLFPAMLLGSIFIFLTGFFIPNRPLGPPLLSDLIPGLTFIEPSVWNKLVGAGFRSLDEAFWSLYVEVKFYLIAALSYYTIRDKKAVGIALLYLIYLLFFASSLLFEEVHLVLSALSVFTFIGVQYYGWFLVGIFFFRYWRTGVSSNAYFSLLFGCLAVIEASIGKGYEVFLHSSLVVVIFWLSFSSKHFSKAMSSRLITGLGLVSYPLYLVHQNFVTGLAIELFRVYDGLWVSLYPLLSLILVLCVSVVLAKYEPMVKTAFANTLLPLKLRPPLGQVQAHRLTSPSKTTAI